MRGRPRERREHRHGTPVSYSDRSPSSCSTFSSCSRSSCSCSDCSSYSPSPRPSRRDPRTMAYSGMTATPYGYMPPYYGNWYGYSNNMNEQSSNEKKKDKKKKDKKKKDKKKKEKKKKKEEQKKEKEKEKEKEKQPREPSIFNDIPPEGIYLPPGFQQPIPQGFEVVYDALPLESFVPRIDLGQIMHPAGYTSTGVAPQSTPGMTPMGSGYIGPTQHNGLMNLRNNIPPVEFPGHLPAAMEGRYAPPRVPFHRPNAAPQHPHRAPQEMPPHPQHPSGHHNLPRLPQGVPPVHHPVPNQPGFNQPPLGPQHPPEHENLGNYTRFRQVKHELAHQNFRRILSQDEGPPPTPPRIQQLRGRVSELEKMLQDRENVDPNEMQEEGQQANGNNNNDPLKMPKELWEKVKNDPSFIEYRENYFQRLEPEA